MANIKPHNGINASLTRPCFAKNKYMFKVNIAAFIIVSVFIDARIIKK
jgi:hypothetical protein